MKKQYQIRAQRAIDKFQEWANGDLDPIQLSLPTADMLKLAQQSLDELLRHVGKIFVESVLEAEVEQVAGQRSKPDPSREAYRWGTKRGYVVIDGQKVPIEKPRVRNRQNNREIPLGSYELFQRASLVGETVWRKIMYGLTMRSYKEVLPAVCGCLWSGKKHGERALRRGQPRETGTIAQPLADWTVVVRHLYRWQRDPQCHNRFEFGHRPQLLEARHHSWRRHPAIGRKHHL